jgi:hypothetical protein
MKPITCLLVAAALVLAPAAGFAADKPALTNADVIKMSKAGLGTEVITNKIAQAETVDFKLETDDLIALKNAGVSAAVISAMQNRADGGSTTTTTTSGGGGGNPGMGGADGIPNSAKLITASGTVTLSPVEGSHKQFAAPFVGLKHFLVFEEQKSKTRIKDTKPSFEIALSKSPRDSWWIVRLDPDDDEPTRGLDLESMGMWGGGYSYEPDGDFVIPAEITEARPGVWKFTVKGSLKTGEYALYNIKGWVYDFGVDK